MCASNLRPEAMSVKIDAWSPETLDDEPFNDIVEAFRCSDCYSNETGKRVVFYQETAR